MRLDEQMDEATAADVLREIKASPEYQSDQLVRGTIDRWEQGTQPAAQVLAWLVARLVRHKRFLRGELARYLTGREEIRPALPPEEMGCAL